MDEKDIATETEEVVEDVEDVTDEVAEDVAEEAKEPTVEDDGFDIDDLEYDENGDVIIPEEEGDKEISEEKEETSKAEDERDSKIKSLEERLAELTSRSKDTLKALGIESEDVLDGLAALTAETEGISVEEYLARRTEAKKATIKSQADFEAVAAADLAALQATFPETKNYKHIKDMPKEILAEFAKNRDLGLPAVKAYAAANVDGIRASTVASVKAEKSGKEHLQSAAPKGAKSTAIKMSRNELNEWRGLFPGMSDRDIVALYRKTAKK
jgi:hypothetical protein